MKSKISTTIWALKTAWQIDKVMLLGLSFLVAVAAVLPAVALAYQRNIISFIGNFVSTGYGTFSEILPAIITFGIILTLVGLSNRLNYDLIFSLMYHKYLVGIVERLTLGYFNFTLEEVMSKDKNNDFFTATYRINVFTYLISLFIRLISLLAGTIALLVVAFSLSIPLFIISTLFIICVILFNAIFDKKSEKRFAASKEKTRLAGHYLNLARNPEAAREIRVFGFQERLLEKWEGAHEHLYKFKKKQDLEKDVRSLFSGLLFNAFVAIMTIYSLFSLYNGNLDVAVLLVIFTLCMNLSGLVSSISRGVNWIIQELHVTELQRNICERKPTAVKLSNTQLETPSDNLFETKNLNFSYPGGNKVLDDVSLSIKKGEIIALVGVNGSGKSTLVNVLLQLFRANEGELYFDGQNYDTLEHGFLKNKIGAFFQDYFLFHLPIFENIGFGDIDHINDRERITQALKKGGAYDFVSKLPKGDETYFGKVTFWGGGAMQDGANFSGGEKQKLGVSRAHISDKDILIFDEPASMLDPLAELEQFEQIKEKAEGRTTILISHRVGFARMADRIVLLDGGRIAEVGTHTELMNIDGLYANFFNEQAQWYKK